MLKLNVRIVTLKRIAQPYLNSHMGTVKVMLICFEENFIFFDFL